MTIRVLLGYMRFGDLFIFEDKSSMNTDQCEAIGRDRKRAVKQEQIHYGQKPKDRASSRCRKDKEEIL